MRHDRQSESPPPDLGAGQGANLGGGLGGQAWRVSRGAAGQWAAATAPGTAEAAGSFGTGTGAGARQFSAAARVAA